MRSAVWPSQADARCRRKCLYGRQYCRWVRIWGFLLVVLVFSPLVYAQSDHGHAQHRQVELERALQELTHDDPFVRMGAAKKLAILGATEHAKEIAALLRDSNPMVRLSATRTLSERLRATEHAKDIVILLHDEDNQVKRTAIEGLVHLNARQYTGKLVQLLNDPSADVRCAALWALEKLQGREHAKELAGLLADSETCLSPPEQISLEEAATVTREGQEVTFVSRNRQNVTTVGEVAARLLKDWGFDPANMKKAVEE